MHKIKALLPLQLYFLPQSTGVTLLPERFIHKEFFHQKVTHMYFGSNRRNVVQVAPANMVNAPTVVPISSPDGANQAMVESSPYFSFKVDTTGLSGTTQIVLFDASQGWQIANSYAMPVGVTITGLTGHYQALLNDIAHVAAAIDIIKMTVSDDSLAGSQFGRGLKVFETVRGSDPYLVKNIYPEMGVSEAQFQKGINTFPANLIISNRTAIVYVQEPDLIVTFGFYQQAEIGRKR
jgi:hypothetical protein